MSLRNIAIIAHVDHGKTTLVDQLLAQSGVFRANEATVERAMDSNDQERERGITILAKNTSIVYKGTKINIVDTPGHQDFGGEVERVLRMADGCLLLVDAADGPMPQTRFVLKKALGHGLQPIVVINKLDKPDARPKEVLDEIFYLFIELEASDAQMDFPVVYAVGRAGQSKLKIEDPWSDFSPLFDTILQRVPAPKGDENGPFQLSVANIDYSDYVGRMAIGRIAQGTVKPGQTVAILKRDGSQVKRSITELQTFVNLKREKTASASAGEIVVISGCPEVDIGDTIADAENPVALPFPKIEEPTLSMHFMVNDSPLSGREGTYVTSRHVGDRIMRETLSDVALRIEQLGPDEWKVSGRGLLHLGILLENMRREGYEVQVSKPEMITKKIDGVLMEPVELAMIDVPNEYAGSVIQLFGARKGFVEKMDQRHERTHFTFRIPARGLVGLQSRLLSATRGQAVIHTAFEGYEEWKGDIPDRQAGVLIAQEDGEATSYAMDGLSSRGQFFTPVGTKVYGGMIVGEHCKEKDLVVNVARKKRLTNMRAASADATVVLAQPRIFGLEEALEYINDDELVEITPKSIRMRKKILDENKRKRASMREMEVAEAGDP
ncbi:MAG TPA: translational GTPase TypA [Planctomycetota bacterium]|nr:translational GTPase TypA [Planctomycetota bacterium]